MADQNLRLTAEVVDRFSGPLRQLREQLRGIQAGPGLKTLQADLRGAPQVVQGTADVIRRSLGPALLGLGVSGLGVSGAIAGVAAALKGFAPSGSGLALRSREACISADRLRVFEGVAQRWG